MLIGYARVSSHDQNLDLQLQALSTAGCDKVFTETVSGAAAERPQLAAALAYVRAGDTLVVWKLDRLARSLRQLIDTVQDLKTRGVRFASLTEAIDTTTSSGELFFHIFGALAEFERALIRERTKAGLAAALARGRKGGRPKSLTDADIVAAKQLLLNPTISVKEVAARLNVCDSTLYRYVPAIRTAIADQVQRGNGAKA
jgi:DNA invertase Pin-like site-specific DNA recombinase